MKVEILRDSIVGVGTIERPQGGPNLGDAIQCGLVVKTKTAKVGQIVTLSETDANRMIQLGSARVPQPSENKKAA